MVAGSRRERSRRAVASWAGASSVLRAVRSSRSRSYSAGIPSMPEMRVRTRLAPLRSTKGAGRPAVPAPEIEPLSERGIAQARVDHAGSGHHPQVAVGELLEAGGVPCKVMGGGGGRRGEGG